MNSFRIFGSLLALVVLFGLIAGCSQSKQASGTSSVVRTDQTEGDGATDDQQTASSSETMNPSENSKEAAKEAVKETDKEEEEEVATQQAEA